MRSSSKASWSRIALSSQLLSRLSERFEIKRLLRGIGKPSLDDAFQCDDELRVLSPRNLTSFRDVLAVPSNGRLVENRRPSQNGSIVGASHARTSIETRRVYRRQLIDAHAAARINSITALPIRGTTAFAMVNHRYGKS